MSSGYESLIYFGQGLMRDLIFEIGDAGVGSSFCDVKTRTGLLSLHLFWSYKSPKSCKFLLDAEIFSGVIVQCVITPSRNIQQGHCHISEVFFLLFAIRSHLPISIVLANVIYPTLFVHLYICTYLQSSMCVLSINLDLMSFWPQPVFWSGFRGIRGISISEVGSSIQRTGLRVLGLFCLWVVVVP